MSADSMKALVAIMQADTALTALLGTRVFGGDLPRAEVPSMPRKCMVLKYAGGSPNSDYVELTEFRIDMMCYGETPFDADQVRRAGHDVMKILSRKVQSNVLIHRANHSGGPISLRDRDTEWPLVLNSYDVLAAEQAIS